MIRLLFILFLSTLGGTLILHYLKNFILKEKARFRLDWDGLLERLCITYIIVQAAGLWLFIPLIILSKTLLRIYLLKAVSGITRNIEPGVASQKVLYKAELAFDAIASPALAILVGVIFR